MQLIPGYIKSILLRVSSPRSGSHAEHNCFRFKPHYTILFIPHPAFPPSSKIPSPSQSVRYRQGCGTMRQFAHIVLQALSKLISWPELTHQQNPHHHAIGSKYRAVFIKIKLKNRRSSGCTHPSAGPLRQASSIQLLLLTQQITKNAYVPA